MRDGRHPSSLIFSGFRRIAVFELRLSELIDRAPMAVCNRKESSLVDSLGVHFK
jgi:hypothetical protein